MQPRVSQFEQLLGEAVRYRETPGIAEFNAFLREPVGSKTEFQRLLDLPFRGGERAAEVARVSDELVTIGRTAAKLNLALAGASLLIEPILDWFELWRFTHPHEIDPESKRRWRCLGGLLDGKGLYSFKHAEKVRDALQGWIDSCRSHLGGAYPQIYDGLNEGLPREGGGVIDLDPPSDIETLYASKWAHAYMTTVEGVAVAVYEQLTGAIWPAATGNASVRCGVHSRRGGKKKCKRGRKHHASA